MNISLDTLREERFERITRRKGLKMVLAGIWRSLEVRFDSVKVNCVVMRGFNDDEVVDFAQLASEHPLEVRFIEFMPFAGNQWTKNLLMPYDEVLARVKEQFPELKAEPVKSSNETSKIFRDSKRMVGSIGFISSMTNNFCSGCTRLRLTTDGNLKVCLFESRETSLRDLIRFGASDDEIVSSICSSLRDKKRQHGGE